MVVSVAHKCAAMEGDAVKSARVDDLEKEKDSLEKKSIFSGRSLLNSVASRTGTLKSPSSLFKRHPSLLNNWSSAKRLRSGIGRILAKQRRKSSP